MSTIINNRIDTSTDIKIDDKDFSLNQIALKSSFSGDIVTNAKKVAFGAVRNRTALTSFTGHNVKTLGAQSFNGCTSLVTFDCPNVTNVAAGDSSGEGYTFNGCSNLLELNFPLCTTENNNAASVFKGCTKLERIHLPYAKRFGTGSFENCSSLQYLVLPSLHTMSGAIAQNTGILGAEFWSLGSFPNSTFANSKNLSILILRKSSITSCSSTNVFSGTPFASTGTGGTLYVPESLIESYEAATNWSTILGYANNSIKKIEGTTYENHYVDGTLFPTYTEVSYERDDYKNLDTSGGYELNTTYASSEFINKNGLTEWELMCNSVSTLKIQEFRDDEFVGMGTYFSVGSKTIDGISYNRYGIFLPNNGNKFRFCVSPRSNFNSKSNFLYSVERYF